MNPANFPENKERKRREAAERQAASDKLTPQERLAKLDERGLHAEKERAKLQERLKGVPLHGEAAFEAPGEPGERPKKQRRQAREEKR